MFSLEFLYSTLNETVSPNEASTSSTVSVVLLSFKNLKVALSFDFSFKSLNDNFNFLKWYIQKNYLFFFFVLDLKLYLYTTV